MSVGGERARLVAGEHFLLRTPALPFDALGAVEQSDELQRRPWRDPFVRAAIELASPSLAKELEAASIDGARAWPRSWVRYLARMATRCTPFGLFAGVSVGVIGDETMLRLGDPSAHRSRARIDAELASEIASSLYEDPQRARALPLGLNPTVYETTRALRFYAPRSTRGRTRYELVDLLWTPSLRACFQRLSQEPVVTAEGLARATARKEQVPIGEARAFIDELVAHGLLLPRMGYTVYGDPSEALVGSLKRWVGDDHPTTRLAVALHDRILACEHAPAHEIVRAARAVVAGSPFAETRQVVALDLVKSAPGLGLDRRIASEIVRGAETLIRISPPAGNSLSSFASAFLRRFDGARVPLLQAVDVELGVGEALATDQSAEMLGGIDWSRAPRSVHTTQQLASHEHLLRRYSETLWKGERELRLTDSDLEALASSAEVPHTISTAVAIGTLSADGEEQLRRGQYTILLNTVMSEATSFLGRFAHVDERFASALSSFVASAERDDEVLYPDLIHDPDTLAATNPCSRPRLRELELWVLGYSQQPKNTPMALRDLFLEVSPEYEVRLIHGPSNKRVLPRLSNASWIWNPAALPVYRLLLQLSIAGGREIYRFDWGPLLKDAHFLPRVTWDRFIFCPACWTVRPGKYSDRGLTTEAAREALGAKIREELGLPRYVSTSLDGRDPTPLDLDQAWAREVLAKACSEIEQGPLMIDELVDVPDKLVVEGPEGRFRHQWALPLKFQHTSSFAPVRRDVVAETTRHTPGGAWCAFKIYANRTVLDELLGGRLQRIFKGTAKIDRWFFVRYADPAPHLRVRLHTRSSLRVIEHMNAALRPYLADGRVWDVSIATYVPEVDRYGGPLAIELCERVFTADSEAVLRALRAFEGDEEARFLFCAHAICALLGNFELSVEACRDRLFAWSLRWREELHLSPEIRNDFGRRYRVARESMVAAAEGKVEQLPPAPRRALQARSSKIAPLARELRALARADGLSAPLDAIVQDLVHMHVNRLFPVRPNEHEALLYDLLARAYDSVAARARSRPRGA